MKKFSIVTLVFIFFSFGSIFADELIDSNPDVTIPVASNSEQSIMTPVGFGVNLQDFGENTTPESNNSAELTASPGVVLNSNATDNSLNLAISELQTDRAQEADIAQKTIVAEIDADLLNLDIYQVAASLTLDAGYLLLEDSDAVVAAVDSNMDGIIEVATNTDILNSFVSGGTFSETSMEKIDSMISNVLNDKSEQIITLGAVNAAINNENLGTTIALIEDTPNSNLALQSVGNSGGVISTAANNLVNNSNSNGYIASLHDGNIDNGYENTTLASVDSSIDAAATMRGLGESSSSVNRTIDIVDIISSPLKTIQTTTALEKGLGSVVDLNINETKPVEVVGNLLTQLEIEDNINELNSAEIALLIGDIDSIDFNSIQSVFAQRVNVPLDDYNELPASYAIFGNLNFLDIYSTLNIQNAISNFINFLTGNIEVSTRLVDTELDVDNRIAFDTPGAIIKDILEKLNPKKTEETAKLRLAMPKKIKLGHFVMIFLSLLIFSCSLGYSAGMYHIKSHKV